MNVQAFFCILLVLFLPLQPSLSIGDMQLIENDSRGIQFSEWLFLVYMDADNNLGSAAESNLAQMMEVGSDSNINILVLLDKNGFGDSRIYNVMKNSLEVVDDGGTVIPETKEVNMGSQDTLRNFLNFSMRYQRNHTFLVLWDHGSGWRGFCTDSQSKDSLNLSEIGETLSKFNIDVLGIDACQGALMEVAYALRNSAKYFVGSQKDEPESGWNYTLLLTMAKTTIPLTPERFATVTVEAFEKHYRRFSLLSVSVALSAINLTRIGNLADAVDNLSLALSTSSFLLHSEISEARNFTETYEGNNNGDADLGDFARKALNSSYIMTRKYAKELLLNLQATVLKSCGITAFLPTSGIRADNASGLSIYFPKSNFNSEYLKTQFANERKWSKFLIDFLSPPPLEPTTLEVRTRLENNTILVENPGNTMIYICDSTTEIVESTNATWMNYTVVVPDYYEIIAYNYTTYNEKSYLNGMFKSERKWVGETKPNIKIVSVEFFREDGVRILGDTGKHPIENRSFVLCIAIANSGNVDVTTRTLVEMGNFRWEANLSIPVNSTVNITLHPSMPFGDCKARIALDPDNNIRETSETDNLYTESVWIKSRIPSNGVTIVLKNPGICTYQIYNETGILVFEGKSIGEAVVYISPSNFRDGEYLYLHIIFDNQALFRKIQVFSEDGNYELSFDIQVDGLTVIDYVFILVSVGLICILVLATVSIFWIFRKINLR